MKHRIKQADLGGLLALLLFGVFAVCILSVLLTGADAYRRLTKRDSASYERRTAVQYLETKLHQADGQEDTPTGGIITGEFNGRDALFLQESAGGTLYTTYIYCADGYLRELFAAEDDNLFALEDGERVTPAADMTVTLGENGLITVTVTSPAGETDTIVYRPRNGVTG